MYRCNDFITSVRFTEEEAELVRSLADKYFAGSISKTIRVAIKKLSAAEKKRETATA